jgi:hypothetical protein
MTDYAQDAKLNMTSLKPSLTSEHRETTWLRFVVFHLVEEYAKLGWMVIPHDGFVNYHDIWGVIMEWPCSCPIREPHKSHLKGAWA